MNELNDDSVPPSYITRSTPAVLSRRSLLLGGAAIAVSYASRSRAEPGNRGRLAIGLSAPTYYNGFSPFLNWWKQADPFQVHLEGGKTLSGKDVWEAGIYLEASTGELCRPVPSELTSLSRIFFTNTHPFQQAIGCDYSGEEFTIDWAGSANVRVDFLTAGGTQRSVTANKVKFKMGINPGNTSITLTITDVNDPPRNIRIYQTRYAQQVLQGAVFNPDWLDVIGPFGIIRCMDWCAVNNSTVSRFDQLADLNYCSWGQPFRSSTTIDDCGTKGGVHPEILCELANHTDAKIHVCIPHRATDEFIASYAGYFRDHAKGDVVFELSNECWNALFTQFGEFSERGNRIWPDDPLRSSKYYGYRAAACMDIIRRTYGRDSRWSGALATQTVSPAITEAILTGVQHWIERYSERSTSPVISELFKGLYVTGYFGDVTTCTQPESVSRSNPAIVKSPRHGYATGQPVRCFFSSGMTQLNERDVNVQKIDDDTYAIDADTTDFGSFVSGTRNYVVPSMIFKVMEESRRRNLQQPDQFPTQYSYFNQEVSSSLLHGQSASGFLTAVSVAALGSKFWPDQLSLARANRLILQQYEGGSHLVGDAYLTGYGGNSQYNEYLLQHGHSREIAAVYSAMYQSFEKLGGSYPCKYLAEGLVSQFGTWAGVRYWPTAANHDSKDIDNPVWRATTAANQSAKK